MIRYHLSYQNPLSGFLQVHTTITDLTAPEIFLQLPAWRPGRYELQNFAQKLQAFRVTDTAGTPLPFRKISKDRWQIETQGQNTIEVHYNFYARQMDAGGSWLAEDLLYVNPVNCLLTAEGQETLPCELTVDIPSSWQMACGLTSSSSHTLQADNFDQLVDAPFMAGPNLQHQTYQEQGIPFHVWFYGDCTPDWNKIISDFQAFTKEQLELFHIFPVQDYHFLNLILPYQHYHGVEHLNSTVITLGPSEQLMTTLYKELLGVSCHELFHTWNIKQIRPVEMQPYDFTRENYFRTGYVAEGVTTYYGDYLLARCGVFTTSQYLEELNTVIKRHTIDQGEANLSVADSSFDTWLDGYKAGIPDRKVSIYHKGCIAALVLDLEIRKATQNQKSLDDVMRRLWQEFGQTGIGYTEADYQRLSEEVAGTSLENYFQEMIFGTVPFDKWLTPALEYVGLVLETLPTANLQESRFGFRLAPAAANGNLVVGYTAPGSPAAAVLSVEDELIALNGRQLTASNLQAILKDKDSVELTLFRQKKLQTVTLTPDGAVHLPQYKVSQNTAATLEQQQNFSAWLKQAF